MTEEQLSSNHPPLPPTTEEDRFSWLRLLRSRKVGPATFRRLLHEHGSAQNALAALPEMARAAGIEGYEICPPGVIEVELKAAKAANAQLLCLGTADFPKALLDVSDAPPLLWAIGDTSALKRPAIAMVGARNCSSLGARMARGLAKELGERGYIVVSGLARGIDTAAHLAAVDSGTVAVMAGGVDVIYPAENTDLARNIEKAGLRLSEQPIGVTPQARHFPRRNRIISGLAQAVVVVEAAAKSGSLITARDALDQGREVLAVPGHPFDARAAGCNLLIRDGATLVRSAEDIIDALPQQQESERQTAVPSEIDVQPAATPAALHREILTRLGPSPIAEDQLIRDIAATAGEIGPALVDLELDGRIQRQPGGLLSLTA
ncbi:DNA-protecting protein DprA [Rhodobacteraceae bacterium B1Z28]|uniref:DNA-protecting protein DprA n=1 Tax=Ruegeria haliotis TaxID=2747601 RepID=A0ABX2PVC4_9RHOB|nr:DNA-processing protein DprA [Ruegeria haliotis]NVO57306.1 DNA-protecting protein DprA [Ruegeria haliotis]